VIEYTVNCHWRETVERGFKTIELANGGPGYPSRLGKLKDPPRELFVRGGIPDGPMVAIVGSRKADGWAKRFAFQLGRDLVRHGLAVISGGALGVDTAAHEGALDGGGPTVAVIGSGFHYMYPKANESLFKEIPSNGGALISEYAPFQPPTKWTFPKRNRIIAALANGVIVVQAGRVSGALITARNARELNIPLGSVPGAAGDASNRGTNQLIRHGATMVEDISDVLRMVDTNGTFDQLPLPGLETEKTSFRNTVSDVFSPIEVKILDTLGYNPLHIDEIAMGAGLGVSETSAAILSLELMGTIEDQGGKNFVKLS
jgi:DNA processing protein